MECTEKILIKQNKTKLCIKITKYFKITVGTRQGCNLSPTLFNLFINDLPQIIGKGDCDPMSLNKMKINMLMYADDMLILSKSRKGLLKM